MQLSGMVCDNFAESSSHHLQSLSIPYTSFFLTCMYVHRSTHSIGFREQKTNSLKCRSCRLLESPCHMYTGQLFIISSQVCRYKTKGSPGKCKFPCTNLARVTFSQISFFKMFPSMLQFSKIVKLCPKCKIKLIKYIAC